MMTRRTKRQSRIAGISALSILAIVAAGCSSSDDGDSVDTDVIGADTDIDETEVFGNFNSARFGDALQSVDEVDCTLENGSATSCMQLVFSSNPVGVELDDGTVGPYCPETTATPRDEAGFAVYDGTTNSGFMPIIDSAEGMEIDGFDIVDDEGNINISDLTPGSELEGLSYCLEAPFEDSTDLTFIIPITPELRTEPSVVGTVESIGVAIDGVPLKGYTPSVTTVEEGIGGTGSGNIPSLDHCGGHPDPAGYYHWHLIPQGTNTVLASDTYNYTELYGITCSNSNVDFDDTSSMAGLAKDGFPFYGPFDSVDGVVTEPSDIATLDECNGHTHTTDEFPDGVFHYHALQDEAPNIPPCLVGSFVEQDFIVGGDTGGGPPPQ